MALRQVSQYPAALEQARQTSQIAKGPNVMKKSMKWILGNIISYVINNEPGLTLAARSSVVAISTIFAAISLPVSSS